MRFCGLIDGERLQYGRLCSRVCEGGEVEFDSINGDIVTVVYILVLI